MNIISKGWYPQYGPVDADSFDFKMVVVWLGVQTKLPSLKLVADPYYGTSLIEPHRLEFTDTSGTQTHSVDAVLAFYHPESALCDLEREFGLPNIYVKYIKPVLPAPPPPPKPPDAGSLVGAPIPNAPGWFHRAHNDTHKDGGNYTGPDGLNYWATSNPFYGPVWYCAAKASG